MSAKDKSNLGKKGKAGRRRDDSEGFDSRSQYTAYYGHPQQTTWVTQQYIPVANTPFTAQIPQPSYQSPIIPPTYGASNQAYQPTMAGTGYMPPANTVQPVRN